MIRWIFKYLVLIFVFCAVAGLSTYFTLSFFIQSEDTVLVPDLTGKNAVAALETLSALELNTRVGAKQYSTEVPEYHVIAQKPAPGRSIKVNREVSLVISRGPSTVTVPDVENQELEQARMTLEQKGLTAGTVTRVYDANTPRRRIMVQHPAPEDGVRRNSPVNLLVSAGSRPKAYMMPDLRGKFLDEAMLSIESHQISLEELKSVHDPSKPENKVTGQAPPPGYRVEAGAPVRLIINRRPGSRQAGRDEKKPLFSHRLAPGFLKQRVRLEMSGFGAHIILHEGLMDPGAVIWAIVPEHTEAAVFLYVNGQLVESQIYN